MQLKCSSPVFYALFLFLIVSRTVVKALFFIVQRTYANIFFELVMEIVYVGITYHFSHLIHFVFVGGEKSFCFGYSYAVKVVIEVITCILMEHFSKVCTVIAEDVRKHFKAKLLAVICTDIADNTLHCTFGGPAVKCIGDLNKLTLHKLDYFKKAVHCAYLAYYHFVAELLGFLLSNAFDYGIFYVNYCRYAYNFDFFGSIEISAESISEIIKAAFQSCNIVYLHKCEELL